MLSLVYRLSLKNHLLRQDGWTSPDRTMSISECFITELVPFDSKCKQSYKLITLWWLITVFKKQDVGVSLRSTTMLHHLFYFLYLQFGQPKGYLYKQVKPVTCNVSIGGTIKIVKICFVPAPGSFPWFTLLFCVLRHCYCSRHIMSTNSASSLSVCT